MKTSQKAVLKHVLVAVLSMILLASIGVGVYALIMNLFMDDGIHQEEDIVQREIISDVSIDKKACNLIYEINENNSLIEGAILEFLDCNTGKLDYVTVPGNTCLQINDEVASTIENNGYNVDKTIKLRDLIETFGSDDAYQYGQLIIQKCLGIKISYYTVFDSKTFAKYFVKNSASFYFVINGKSEEYEYELYELSEPFLTRLDDDSDKVEDILRESYLESSSNLNLDNKYNYLKVYPKVELDRIYVWHLIGKQKFTQFILDKEKNAKLIKYIVDNKKQYVSTQEEYCERIKKSMR